MFNRNMMLLFTVLTMSIMNQVQQAMTMPMASIQDQVHSVTAGSDPSVTILNSSGDMRRQDLATGVLALRRSDTKSPSKSSGPKEAPALPSKAGFHFPSSESLEKVKSGLGIAGAALDVGVSAEQLKAALASQSTPSVSARTASVAPTMK